MTKDIILDFGEALNKLKEITTETSNREITLKVNDWINVLRKKNPKTCLLSLSLNYFDKIGFEIDNEKYTGPAYFLVFLAGERSLTNNTNERILFFCPFDKDNKIHNFACSFKN